MIKEENGTMVLETYTAEEMKRIIAEYIEYYEKGEVPEEQKILKEMIIKELLGIYVSLGNIMGLITTLEEQLEEREKEQDNGNSSIN